jgi:hypothetical protein
LHSDGVIKAALNSLCLVVRGGGLCHYVFQILHEK